MWRMKIKRRKRLPVETAVAREGWVDGEMD